MAAKLKQVSDDRYLLWCPGCNEPHQFYVGPGGWTFNGHLEHPTIHPSLLVRTGHYASGFVEGSPCWCNYRSPDGQPAPFKCLRCHSFVRDGQIQFLDDCSHKLKGRTVDLPDWKD